MKKLFNVQNNGQVGVGILNGFKWSIGGIYPKLAFPNFYCSFQDHLQKTGKLSYENLQV